MPKIYDVIIVGAGASGLSCAEALNTEGIEFLLVEGKSRIGGRVFSHLSNYHRVPIELGAEFIHGVPKYTLDWLKRLNQPFYDV